MVHNNNFDELWRIRSDVDVDVSDAIERRRQGQDVFFATLVVVARREEASRRNNDNGADEGRLLRRASLSI